MSDRTIRGTGLLVSISILLSSCTEVPERSPGEAPVSPPRTVQVSAAELALEVDGLLERGQDRRALELCIRRLLRDPRDRLALIRTVQIIEPTHPDLARSLSRTVDELSPAEAERRLARGYAASGEIELAARHRARALTHELLFRRARQTLLEATRAGSPGAEIYLVEHDVIHLAARRALDRIEKLRKRLGADHPDLVGWSALARARLDEPEEAATRLIELVSRSPELSRIWMSHLARLFLEDLGRPREVLEAFRLHAAAFPDAATRRLEARYLLACHLPRAALELYEKLPGTALEDPRDRVAWIRAWRLTRGVEPGLLKAVTDLAVDHPRHPEGVQLFLELLDAGVPARDLARPLDLETENLRDALNRRANETRRSWRRIRNARLTAHEERGKKREEALLELTDLFREIGDRPEALRHAHLALDDAETRGSERAWRAILDLRQRPGELFFQLEARSHLGEEFTPEIVMSRFFPGIEDREVEGRQEAVDPVPAVSRKTRFHFVDRTEHTGIEFRNVCGGLDKDFILEMNGAGVALVDVDLDGKLDIYLVNGSDLDGSLEPRPTDRLYRNLGDFRFEDITERAGVSSTRFSTGIAVGDYDSDGDPDLHVTGLGPDALFRNRGDGTFEEVSSRVGILEDRWGSSSVFLDHDRDGHLDLFVVNYLSFDPEVVPRRGRDPRCQYRGVPIACGPSGLPAVHASLFRNLGDGTFRDVSGEAGIESPDLATHGYGLGVTVLDFDRDGWLDLYVANDSRPNHLFRNLGDGTFEEIGLSAGVALNARGRAQAGMGVDAWFPPGSRYEDLFVVNFSRDSNTYYQNQQGEFFLDATDRLGLASAGYRELGWATFFFDADHDGIEEIFIACGHVAPQVETESTGESYQQRNLLLSPTRAGAPYEDVTARAGPGFEIVRSSRGAAFGDLDGDGDLDIVIQNIDERPTILENRSPPADHHFVTFELRATEGHRDAIGAVVTIEVEGVSRCRRVRGGSSYASHGELVAHFGLGTTHELEKVVVEWPGGKRERFSVEGVDRRIRLVEGEGTSITP